jgi:hypothetical protein
MIDAYEQATKMKKKNKNVKVSTDAFTSLHRVQFCQLTRSWLPPSWLKSLRSTSPRGRLERKSEWYISDLPCSLGVHSATLIEMYLLKPLICSCLVEKKAAEKGHVIPKDHLDSKEKELIKVATKGGNALFVIPC